MDPLTAFSLTCGVIQVVDFSTKIVVRCRQLYKDGVTSENKEIESMAKHLTALATGLKLPTTLQIPESAPHLYHDDKELLKLAKQCSETAMELISELQKLAIASPQRKRDAFRKAIKVIWKKDTIENIQRSLEWYRRTLDTRILINLRQKVHLVLSEQGDGLKNLDGKLQNLIIGVSTNQSTFNELKDLIKAENVSSKKYVSQELQKHREIIATEESYNRLLESLYFPDIRARQEGIAEAHKHTFEWIFDKPGNEVRPWHHLIDWLENGHGTYWISGKAGSGKSTLMNFICDDPRTDAALRIWSGDTKIFRLKFFFWSPGSQLQKSLVGLLRSLIYQILKGFPDLMPMLAKSMDSLHQLPTWTEQRLRVTLQNLLSIGLEQCRLCIFIDGLDEFQGDHAILLGLISNLKEITTVKFCLSSRPYRLFRDELTSSPMLKLQDLTEPDIRRYVSDKLGAAPLKASWIPHTSSTIKVAVNTIVEKAEGVFLWVRLAVRDQLEGIRNGDDAEQLRERLQILPTEIEELYGHMLQGVAKFYRKEVARYIRLVLDVEGHWSLLEYALAEHKRIDDILLSSADISTWDLRQHCKSINERVAATCKGFLEVREEPWAEQRRREVAESFSKLLEDRNIPLEQREVLTEMKDLHNYTEVEFLHRTAFDFFKDNEEGKEFLKIHTTANAHPQVLYVKALLAGLVIFPISMKNEHVQESTLEIMKNANIAEQVTMSAQPALMDLIDRSMTRLYKQSPDQLENLHWCRVWGIFEGQTAWYSISLSRFLIRANRSSEQINYDYPIGDPVDFLGLSAWYGLDKYVQHILESKCEGWKSGTADYLLSCSVGGLRMSINNRSATHWKLVAALLERGANPNMEVLEGTVWSFFLFQLNYDSYFRPTGWDQANWVNIIKVFLESGADMNVKFSGFVYIELGIYPEQDVTHSDKPPLINLTSSFIGLHLSPRTFLHLYLGKAPNFFEVQDHLIASGATFHLECTYMFFLATKGAEMKWVNAKLSEQQLNQLTEAFKEHQQRDYSEESNTILKQQVQKLVQELDMEQLYEQAPSFEEFFKKDSWAEESQEHQNSANTDCIPKSSSIDAPASSTDASNNEAEGPSHSTQSSRDED